MLWIKKRLITPDSLSLKKKKFFNDCGDNDAWDFYKNNVNNYSYRTSDVKRLLLEASNNRCVICSRSIYDSNYIKQSNSSNAFTIEHIVPKNEKPELIFDLENMIPCCSLCNNCRGEKKYDSNLYINPCVNFEIENCIAFSYDGNIYCSDLKYMPKLNYMIDLYNLNGVSKRNNIKNERKRYYKLLVDEDYQKMVKLNNEFGLSDNIILFKDMFLFNERNT